MKSFKRNLITAALPYGNGPIHIGHLAGAYLPADIFVRYLRLKGKDVVFVCGLDEHGVPITLRARKEGISPKELVDKYYNLTKNSFEKFGISFDVYHRTSDPLHHKTAQEFFLKLKEKNVFIEEESEQFYDIEENQFLADRYIIGTCPNCGYENAYGDQCERCGTTLSPKELINPKSAISGSAPVLRKSKHWYLPLNNYEDWLRKWILEEHKDDWKTNVYGQCKSWLDDGLKPRAMTRDLDWGVKVPLKDAEGKVLYVWFDAPIGYISATKFWAIERARHNEKFSDEDWKKYWQDEETRLIHFIGKDNIVFHCIIFPVILKVHGAYILPDNVPANEFLNLEGEKISTSRNWAVWLNEYLDDLPGKEDVLRYVLCSILPEAKDNEFTWNDFQSKNNNELVAVFGNFVNRVMVLTKKYFDGKVPAINTYGSYENEIADSIKLAPEKISASLEKFRNREALNEMMNVARIGNKYLTDTEPWKSIKSDEAAAATVLNTCLQIIANLSILCEPFLPFTANKLRHILNIGNLNWEDAGSLEILSSGHSLNENKLLFEKVDDALIEKQKAKLLRQEQKDQYTPTEQLPDIDFEDFMKMDIRIATIASAEKVAKAKKLLKLELDLGKERRTVVSGIAEHYAPEEIIGKEVVYLANLKSKKIRGVDSQGMVLMAEDETGKLSFISPEKSISKGSKVR